jgi:hypothetical protein
MITSKGFAIGGTKSAGYDLASAERALRLNESNSRFRVSLCRIVR